LSLKIKDKIKKGKKGRVIDDDVDPPPPKKKREETTTIKLNVV
jgi:hypothetical protein